MFVILKEIVLFKEGIVLVEEAPCPTLTDEERNALGDAVKAASAVSIIAQEH